jgi:hypothetical protein
VLTVSWVDRAGVSQTASLTTADGPPQ